MSLLLESSLELTFEYDADEDTLFAWVGDQPRPAITYETEDGHLVRLDPDTKEFVGVTIRDYEARWANQPITLAWEADVEEPVPWIPRIARKRRSRVAERRVLRGDHVTV